MNFPPFFSELFGGDAPARPFCQNQKKKMKEEEQKEYYQLFSYFNNIDESGLYSYFTNSVPTPTLAILDDEQKKQAYSKQSYPNKVIKPKRFP